MGAPFPQPPGVGLSGFLGLLCTPGRHQHLPGDGSHLPHPSNPSRTCCGGTALRWSKGRVRLWLLSAAQSRDHQPPAQACGACGVPRGAHAQSRGDFFTLILLNLQPAKPLALYFMSYQHRSEPCFILSFSGVLGSSGSRENAPQNLPFGSFPGRQRSHTRACCRRAKMADLEALFFTNPKAEACWYSMYLEGLKSHLPESNYLTIQCFP